ncbi:APH(3') family aminoglycoside O-phosphotransferase [Amphibacillus sp. Q70]|uniref:APH(3') family aminoglycoside O-phosphotransferase n=1 Tax=Amphibacillus sp. Q70 TaxID=3453416 RepID=UPI003F843D3F
MNLPNKIEKIIGDKPYSIDKIGRSDSQVIGFDDMILKIEKQHEESVNEHRMMAWLDHKLPVPQILCSETSKGINYLLMSKIKGEMASSAVWLEQPNQLVKLLADGLRMLWEVDLSTCPYDHSIDRKLKQAEIRVHSQLCSIEDAEPTTYGTNGFKNPEELLQWLKENKPKEELVFSHGDYCLPNIFIKDNKINGFIDLGRAGIADKYQDIALCYRCLKHKLDGTFTGKIDNTLDPIILFDVLKIKPDWDKINFYILLDELF